MRIYEGPTGEAREVMYSFDAFPTRPAIRFESSGRPDSPTTTKVCGTPYLPEHAPYPRRDGRPMLFIAQFNFSEFEALPGFPTEGLLQLFIPDEDLWGMVYSEEDRKAWDRVPTQIARYLPDISAPHVGEVPHDIADSDNHPAEENFLEATTLTGGRTEQLTSWRSKEFSSYAFYERDPHALLRRGDDIVTLHEVNFRIVTRRFIRGEETMHTSEPAADSREELLNIFGTAVDALEREGFTLDPTAESLLEPARSNWSEHTRLGGYPVWLTDCMLRPGDPRVLLASVAHTGNLMWGDNGYGNFFIHPDDLAARNFDRVIFGWECS